MFFETSWGLVIAQGANPRSPKHFFCTILRCSSKIAKATFWTKIWGTHPRPPKHFFRNILGLGELRFTSLGELALCWGNWAQELGEPVPQRWGNRPPEPPDPISLPNCKNPKASLVGEKGDIPMTPWARAQVLGPSPLRPDH